jgi:diacylglycerol kinase family enzyme
MSSAERSERDIVLVCNPGAGGRWRELAGILDSPEAMLARRIVTDEIADITASLRRLGREAKLICIYGGDGTILKLRGRPTPTKLPT